MIYVTIGNKLILMIIIVYSLIHNPAALAVSSEATAAYSLYRDGQVEKASNLLKLLADSGDSYAAYVLGLIALDSYSAASDFPLAVRWFVQSSRGGFSEADLALGNVYQNEWTKTRDFEDYKSSKYYYERARKNHFSTVKDNLKLLEEKYNNYINSLINPIPLNPNLKSTNRQASVRSTVVATNLNTQESSSRQLKSLPLTEKITSAELRAILNSPVLLEAHPISKQPVAVSTLESARKTLTDAMAFIPEYFVGLAGSGQFFSLVILVLSTVFILRFGSRFFRQFFNRSKTRGRDTPHNNKHSFSSLLPTAREGDKFAQYALAQLYENSYDPPESHKKANYWYQLSAEQGYALAQYKLAVNYLYGYGFSRNKVNARKAIHWLNLAVEQNYIIALYELGRCYENGWGVEKDINFALGLYSQASSASYGENIDGEDDNSQSDHHASHNLVSCPYCSQTIRTPNKLPSSIIRCQSCAQRFSIIKDRYGNRQVQKEGAGRYDNEDIRITLPGDAFEILGINQSSASGDITKAYREKIARYHPDKLFHLGDEFQDIADYKTKQLVAAYQYLRNEGYVA